MGGGGCWAGEKTKKQNLIHSREGDCRKKKSCAKRKWRTKINI